ncbi:MAG TPA: S41 family peptidase [Bacteroidales bacterium]|nr:S41 family peptidase [Bacteroidales bacterium]HPS16594.1 S41 family peptidase [Bacteroidales bacterium]
MEDQEKRKKLFIYMPILLALVLIAGMFLGSIISLNSSFNKNIFSYNPGGYNKFNDVLKYIEESYVDSITKDSLTEKAISSLLENLDPHSVYISAAEFKEANESLQGSFEGIGVEFRVQRDTVTVINVIAGGPSEQKGIMGGDRIVKVDGKNIASVKISNTQVIKLLKGPKGTEVKISVSRRGVKGLIDFTITRDVIPTYSMDIAYMITKKIGYIKLNKFSATTYDEFAKGLKDLKSKGMTKLILDLRDNGGGYLQAAINVADEFLPDGKLIVYTKGAHKPKDEVLATKNGSFENNSLVVLINEFSASASEIVAGAIQDNDRGTIIGRRSFGKGLVQEQLKLYDGSAIRLTVSRYYTPTGRCIQKPYGEGTEEYYNEFYQRFIDGELETADSIKFADSLKFKTPKGKIVYGGGGIMPDVFVGIGKEEDSKYFISLFNKGLFIQYAFDYVDKNRKTLKATYPDADVFLNKFYVDNSILNEFVAYTEKNGIKKDTEGFSLSEKNIKTYLKAFIGRNLYNDKAFYPTLYQTDKTVQKAIEVLDAVK